MYTVRVYGFVDENMSAHFYVRMANKRFVIISNKVNNYGYRVDTSGMDLTQYQRNPILLFMHQRAYRDEDGMPIGTIKDLRLEPNGDITGEPVFTDATEHAKAVARMVEDGTYKMLSAGFEPISTSDAPEDMVQGQRYATITRSKLIEVSVVDIGGDDNAMCLHHAGKTIMLNGYSPEGEILIEKLNNNSIKTQMKEHLIPLLMLAGLSKEGTIEQLMQKFGDLKKRAEDAETALQQKEDSIATLNDTIATLQQAAADAEIDNMLNTAQMERRIFESQIPIYKQAFANKPEDLKKLLATLPANPTLQQHLADSTGSADNPLVKLSYEEAHKKGVLGEIKAKYPERYKLIFKEKFGKEPQA